MDAAQAGNEQDVVATSPPARNVGKIAVRFVVLLASSIALMAFVWSR